MSKQPLGSEPNGNLKNLTQIMKDNAVDYCMLTNNDPNFSACPDPHYLVLDYLIGFSDTNAAFVYSKNGEGYLFTDSRYELEFKDKLDAQGISLIINPNPEVAALAFVCELSNSYKEPLVLAFDDSAVRFTSFIAVEPKNKPKVAFKTIKFMERLWPGRPQAATLDVFDIENMVFPNTYTRIFPSRSYKIKSFMKSVNDVNPDACVLFTSQADISWLLNIRCYQNTPSLNVPSFLLLMKSTGYLFVRGNVDSKLKHDFNFLDSDCPIRSIKVFPFDDFSQKVHFLVPHGSEIFQLSDSSCALLALSRDNFEEIKSRRSDNEIKSVSSAFLEDAIAFSYFSYNWSCDENYFSNEFSAVQEFNKIREKNKYYISESFKTIFAYKENGAMPHYAPLETKSSVLKASAPIVFDFGSQYDFGTTDTTRTLMFGKPSKEHKYYYTAVLKAHLFLQMYPFDIGIEGIRLDTMVRGILTKFNIETPHSIGHGVAMLGDVHDTIPALSYTIKPQSLFKIRPGMIFTSQPGVYLENKFGIRIENTVVAKKCEIVNNKMTFEPLTKCPYEKALINKSMLDSDEIEFINKYHKNVYDSVKDMLEQPVKNYLEKICSPI